MDGGSDRSDRSLETDGSGNVGSDSEETVFRKDTSDRSWSGDHGERSISDRPSSRTSTEERSSTEQSAEGSATKQPLGTGEVYCTSCGRPIKERAEICPHCGVRQRPPPSTTTSHRKKSPELAALASMIWTGTGQIYNAQFAKGIVLMVLLIGAGFFTIGVAIAGIPAFIILPLVVMPLIWIYSIVDAYRTATRLNDRQQRTGS